jgi:putative molybdenum carrier protein
MPPETPPTPWRGGVVARVVTGGQSGVDRAATDVAIALGVPYGGWVPKGGWAEDRPIPPGLLTTYGGFVASESDDPDERTARNVQAADATLVLLREPVTSPGTARTRRCAEALGIPLAVVDLAAPDRDAQLASFCARLKKGCSLNVAGPRESEDPGIYAAATSFLLAHRRLLFGR